MEGRTWVIVAVLAVALWLWLSRRKTATSSSTDAASSAGGGTQAQTLQAGGQLAAGIGTGLGGLLGGLGGLLKGIGGTSSSSSGTTSSSSGDLSVDASGNAVVDAQSDVNSSLLGFDVSPDAFGFSGSSGNSSGQSFALDGSVDDSTPAGWSDPFGSDMGGVAVA